MIAIAGIVIVITTGSALLFVARTMKKIYGMGGTARARIEPPPK